MISIVIPAYNEETVISETIENIHSVLIKQGIDYEIIAVNDGSTDNTDSLLGKRNDIIFISRKINRGYGFSLKEGINKSIGTQIIIIDADGSYPIDKIPSLIKESSGYEMVIGERSGGQGSMSIFNKIAKLTLKILIYFLSSIWIKDINSGLRIFNKELAEKYWSIIPDGFSFTTTITVAALIEQSRVKFIPINYYPRVGKSKIKPVQDFFSFVILVFRIISFFKPLRFYLPIAIFFLIATIIRAIRDIIMFNSIETAAVLLFMISLQTFFFGLLADMIVSKFNSRTK